MSVFVVCGVSRCAEGFASRSVRERQSLDLWSCLGMINMKQRPWDAADMCLTAGLNSCPRVRSDLFWDSKQSRIVVYDRSFGTTYRSRGIQISSLSVGLAL